MSYLSNLYRRLSNLRSEKSDIEVELRKYNERKKEVEDMIRDLSFICDNNCSNVNVYENNIVSFIADAIKGITNISTLEESVNSQKESDSCSDSNISQSLGNLRLELNAIKRKIDNLKSDLNIVNGRINNMNNSIKNEERRLVRERIRQEEERRREKESAIQSRKKTMW